MTRSSGMWWLAPVLSIGSLLGSGPAAPGQVRVGVHVPAEIDTPTHYAGTEAPGAGRSEWVHVLHYPGATYIAIHFQDFALGPEDYLIVSDAEGGQAYELQGKGKLEAGTFWSRHVKGNG